MLICKKETKLRFVLKLFGIFITLPKSAIKGRLLHIYREIRSSCTPKEKLIHLTMSFLVQNAFLICVLVELIFFIEQIQQ